MQLCHFYRNLFAFCRPVSPEGSLACLGDKIGCAQLSLKKVGRRGEKAANLEFCARPLRLCFFALQFSCALEWNASFGSAKSNFRRGALVSIPFGRDYSYTASANTDVRIAGLSLNLHLYFLGTLFFRHGTFYTQRSVKALKQPRLLGRARLQCSHSLLCPPSLKSLRTRSLRRVCRDLTFGWEIWLVMAALEGDRLGLSGCTLT